ncbi:MAG: SpoVR family protein [Chloroflexi bacterium]|nr:MAG: SpoVR family protein [Chloroflexota bacterium]
MIAPALPPDLAELQAEIEAYAREYGLDFPEIRYQMLDYKTMNLVAAYDGFPTRYPHWRFGMEYERLSKSYAYGLHRIYEMVINTDPCYAYLLVSNLRVDQKLVMAHVCGHADFFKNNLWFAHTNRKMLDEMANHAARIRSYINRYGLEAVEQFLDACLSLDNLIDIHAPGVKRRPEVEDSPPEEMTAIPKLKAKDYMDPFINPPEYIAAQQQKLQAAREQRKQFPEQPERDVLLFLMHYAPLENWQRDILGIVREEAYYFAPQRQTKIMNEGWASYWHSTIMTQRALKPEELIDYADHHAGTIAAHPGRLNPYRLGLELFRDIEDRWNRGAFGPEYEACDSLEARRNWDRQLGLGREKIFEVRRIYNDVGFIDAFLTEDFAREHKLFAFAYNERQEQYEISSRDFQEIKRKLLFQLTNFGQPIIDVVDANYENRGELYLVHRHEGIDLDVPFAEATLENLHFIWNRPVHLETVVQDSGRVLFSFGPDGPRQRKLD